MNADHVTALELSPDELFAMLHKMDEPLRIKLLEATVKSIQGLTDTIASCNYDIEITIHPRWEKSAKNQYEAAIRQRHREEVQGKGVEHAKELINKMLQHLDMEALLHHAKLLERVQDAQGGSDGD